METPNHQSFPPHAPHSSGTGPRVVAREHDVFTLAAP